MSASTFLLVLAGVIVVLVAFFIKSWSELSNINRRRRNDKDEKPR